MLSTGAGAWVGGAAPESIPFAALEQSDVCEYVFGFSDSAWSESMRILQGLCFAALTMMTAAGTAAEVERVERGNLVIENIPEIPGRISDRLRQYRESRYAAFQGWDEAGGGIYVTTRFGETNQVHHVAKPGGARRQLTFFDEPVSAVAAPPAGDRRVFIFPKDVGGGEFYQLFMFDQADGSVTQLTDGESRNGSVVWSNSGERFAYYSTRRNQRDWDLYVSDIGKPQQARMVLSEGGTWIPLDWSADDSRLLAMKYVSVTETYYYVVDVGSGSLQQVNPSEQKIAYGDAAWDRRGNGLYLTSDEGSDFRQLRHYDLSSGKQKVLSGGINWDVEQVAISDDGRRLAFSVNEDGVSRLYLMNTDDDSMRRIENAPVGVIGAMDFDHSGARLALTVDSPLSPDDVFSIDIERGILTRWTDSEVGGLDSGRFVEPELVRYPTFDSDSGGPPRIPAFYYRPEGVGPFPVVIVIHGGPEGQSRPVFSSFYQYLASERGYAVIRPNVRGSTGYGKEYVKLDNGFKRKDSVKDIGALLDWIKGRPELDADRIAVYGGSYGGYMVLASMVDYNDRLACGVDVVGISNFVTFLENTKEYRRDLRRVEYGDERDPKMREFLEDISPNNHAEKITKPMLIVQGYNDPRVPVGESEQMLEEMRGNGQNVWYLMARDEGHGFRKKINRDYYLNSTAMFFEQCLGQ